MSREDILRDIPARIEQVRNAELMCQFSAEDATRTEDDFLAQVYHVAEMSGAQILNVPDTVGFTDPDEYAKKL
jgi:2-isopropylmalate synthase